MARLVEGRARKPVVEQPEIVLTRGRQARAMLEQFLEQVKEAEAKYREEESTD